MKIAVYTIAKNEEANIEGWAASCHDADYAVVCDTGSTDNTFEAFHKYVDYIWKISVEPWRFDTAHNVALALVPADADICIPLHLDERLTPGWRQRIEKACYKGKTTQIFYPYKWSDDLTFMQNRIHGRKGMIWRYPDHEGIFHYFDTEPVQVTVAGQEPLIVQEQKPRPLTDAILKRLQWALDEFPGDTRVMYYLARELTYHGRFDEAIPILTQYLSVDTKFPFEQRDAAALLYKCYRNKAADPFDKRSSLSEKIEPRV